ncbi:MAG TPA: thioredoxin [Verrucomicrobiales bacterium]|nr:thioredoxin [Verrucomicrobiales bacterium]
MNTIELNKDNFESTLQQSDRPVLVDFWAEWCGPCKMLGPVLEEIAGEAGERATIAKLNVDEHPDLANRFGVQSIPTLVFFNAGAEQSRLVGVVPKSAIKQRLALN